MGARVLLAFGWFIGHMLPLALGPSPASFEMSNGSSNFTTGLILCFMLPAFIIGFNTFAFLRFFCFRLKLDNKNAVGKEFIQRELLLEEQEKALAD